MPRDFNPNNLTGGKSKEQKKDLPMPPAVINELKQVLPIIKDEASKIIPEIVKDVENEFPIVKTIINDVEVVVKEAEKYMAVPDETQTAPTNTDVVDDIVEDEKEEPIATATKQTLRICDHMNVEVHVMDDDDDEITSEMDTITLGDTILPYEECIVSVVPKAGLPIKQVVSAYLVMDKTNINFDL